MSEREYDGIPRSKIPWDPIVDYERCITCNKCVEFCHVGAFAIKKEEGNRKTVVKPNKCIVFCRGCEDICPTKAITHPSEKQTQKIIDKLKTKKQV